MTRDVSTREDLFRIVGQLSEERESAKTAVDALLARESIPWDEPIPEDMKTVGFVQELTRRIDQHLNGDESERALDLAQYAAAIAAAISVDRYHALVLNSAHSWTWMAIARSQRYLSRAERALQSIRVAEEATIPESLAYQLARSLVGRANIYHLVDRYEDALKAADRAEVIYADHGDRRGLITCRIIRANLDYDRGRFSEARKTFEAILPDAVAGDARTDNLAGIYNNLAFTCERLGDYKAALEHLRECRRLCHANDFSDIDNRAEVALARVAMSMGDLDSAIAALQRIRSRRLGKGRTSEAANTGLDLVDALVAAGRRVEALDLTKEVIAELRGTNLFEQQSRATAYLRDVSALVRSEGTELSLQNIFDVVSELESERAAARPLIKKLLASDLDAVVDMPIRSEWKTAGFVQALTSEGMAILERDAQAALSLLLIALAVIRSIPPGAYPAPLLRQLESILWKEIGYTHGYQGSRQTAARAQATAHQIASTEPSLAHTSMRAKMDRGFTLAFLHRFHEAEAVARECGEFFSSYGDERRAAMCKMLLAQCAIAVHDEVKATQYYKEAIPVFERAKDLHSSFTCYYALGFISLSAGRSAEARVALLKARQTAVALDLPAEVERVDWQLAAVLLDEGQFERSALELARIRTAFARRGMLEDCAQSGLYLAEALVALGRTDEALRLTDQVLSEFRSFNLNDVRIPAMMELLRRLRSSGQRARDEIRHVRRFVERSRLEPDLVFVPLPD